MKIKELKIFTAEVAKQLAFYSDVLGLEIKSQSESHVSLVIGKSILTFVYRKQFTPYHFAINIPSNKENEALGWLKKRVEILKNEESDIQYFDFWNAYAIYFYDADKNIVEFIARKNLNNDSDKDFDQNLVLEISEIGLPTNSIKQEFKVLNKNANLEIFSGGFESFCSIGDEKGMFICIDKGIKKYWFPTKDKPFSSDFLMDIEQLDKPFQIKYQKEVLEVNRVE